MKTDPGDHHQVELIVRDLLARVRRRDRDLANSDRATVIEAAAELEQRIRAERAGYDVSRAEEIRAAALLALRGGW